MRDSMKKLGNYLAKVNCGDKLINQFRLHKFIPNKWFDGEVTSNTKVMIVGQDGGPYLFLKRYIDQYEIDSKEPNFDYSQFLLKTFTARTEKIIIRSLRDGYKKKFNKEMTDKDWRLLFFTVAELFCRSGRLFRGNDNFDVRGVELSLPFLKRQIKIVKPKVILTLGDMALKQVISALDIPIKYKTLTQLMDNIKDKKYFVHNDIIIIPSFHPAAHVNPKDIYNRIGMVGQFVQDK